MNSEQEKFQRKAEVLKALAHPVRLQILKELCVNRTNVTALYTKLGIAQSTVSHHLSVLRNAGVVTGVRNGLEIDYSLECERMEAFIQMIIRD